MYFEIDDEDDSEGALRRQGYSKEDRVDRPQIVVGMAVTRDGLPVRSWVFPGNIADVTTIERVKDDLQGWRLNRCPFVADAEMLSEENLHVIAGGSMHYFVAVPCQRATGVAQEVLLRPGRF